MLYLTSIDAGGLEEGMLVPNGSVPETGERGYVLSCMPRLMTGYDFGITTCSINEAIKCKTSCISHPHLQPSFTHDYTIVAQMNISPPPQKTHQRAI